MIPLTRDWALGHEPRNWVIYQRVVSKKTGAERWEAMSFHRDISQASRSLFRHALLVEPQMQTLTEVQERADRLLTALSEALESAIEQYSKPEET